MDAMAVLLVLFASDPSHQPTCVQWVDCIELNHVYQTDTYGWPNHTAGKWSLDQLIFWDHSDCERKVMSWHLLKKERHRKQWTKHERQQAQRALERQWIDQHGEWSLRIIPDATPPFLDSPQVPHYCHRSRAWYATILKKNVLYVIYSHQFLETWTEFDREVGNQAVHPMSERVDIFLRPAVFRSKKTQ